MIFYLSSFIKMYKQYQFLKKKMGGKKLEKFFAFMILYRKHENFDYY